MSTLQQRGASVTGRTRGWHCFSLTMLALVASSGCLSDTVVVVVPTAVVTEQPGDGAPVATAHLGQTLSATSASNRQPYRRVTTAQGDEGYVWSAAVQRWPLSVDQGLIVEPVAAPWTPRTLLVGEAVIVAGAAPLDGLELVVDDAGMPLGFVPRGFVARASSAAEAVEVMVGRGGFERWLQLLRLAPERGWAGADGVALLAVAESVWKNRRPLRVAVVDRGAPMAAAVGDRWVGFDMAVATALANRVSRPLVLMSVSSLGMGDGAEAVDRGLADVALGVHAAVAADRPGATRAVPYWRSDLVPVSLRRYSRTPTPPPAAQVALSAREHVAELAAARPDLHVSVAPTPDAALAALRSGKVEYAVLPDVDVLSRFDVVSMAAGPGLAHASYVAVFSARAAAEQPMADVDALKGLFAGMRRRWDWADPLMRCDTTCRPRPGLLPGHFFAGVCQDDDVIFAGGAVARDGRLTDTPTQRVYAALLAELKGMTTGAAMPVSPPPPDGVGPWRMGACPERREVVVSSAISLGSAVGLAALAETMLEFLPLPEERARGLEAILESSDAAVGSQEGCVIELVRLENVRRTIEGAMLQSPAPGEVPDAAASGQEAVGRQDRWPWSSEVATETSVFAQELVRSCRSVVVALADRSPELEETYWRGEDDVEDETYPDMELEGDSESAGEPDTEPTALSDERRRRFFQGGYGETPPPPLGSQLSGVDADLWRSVRGLLRGRRIPLAVDALWPVDLDGDGEREVVGIALVSLTRGQLFVLDDLSTSPRVLGVASGDADDPQVARAWADAVPVQVGVVEQYGRPALAIDATFERAFDRRARIHALLVYDREASTYRDLGAGID